MTLLLFNAIALIVIGLIGVCGNVSSIVYFGRVRLRRDTVQRFYDFMICLAIFDLIVIISCMLCFGLPHLFPEVRMHSSSFILALISRRLTKITMQAYFSLFIQYIGKSGIFYSIAPWVLAVTHIGLTGNC